MEQSDEQVEPTREFGLRLDHVGEVAHLRAEGGGFSKSKHRPRRKQGKGRGNGTDHEDVGEVGVELFFKVDDRVRCRCSSCRRLSFACPCCPRLFLSCFLLNRGGGRDLGYAPDRFEQSPRDFVVPLALTLGDLLDIVEDLIEHGGDLSQQGVERFERGGDLEVSSLRGFLSGGDEVGEGREAGREEVERGAFVRRDEDRVRYGREGEPVCSQRLGGVGLELERLRVERQVDGGRGRGRLGRVKVVDQGRERVQLRVGGEPAQDDEFRVLLQVQVDHGAVVFDVDRHLTFRPDGIRHGKGFGDLARGAGTEEGSEDAVVVCGSAEVRVEDRGEDDGVQLDALSLSLGAGGGGGGGCGVASGRGQGEREHPWRAYSGV